jgi:hypothetical protein
MVNELRELMREASGHPPQESGDLTGVLRHGRRRVRVRRASVVGGTALAAGAITLASVSWLNPSPADLAAAGVPRPEGPSIRLTDSRPAVEGTDYRELTSYTNEDLEADNGAYVDGVTDDGLVLFRDGPRADRPQPRYALMDPTTGDKRWLATPPGDGEQSFPLQLGAAQLVLMRLVNDDGGRTRPELDVFDRGTGTWFTVSWPTLPSQDDFPTVRMGPDGRVYVTVRTELWSASLTDPADVRDEGLRVGDFGFDGDRLVYTDSTNGAAGRVYVRDLATGEETSFDPQLGERCNLLGFDVAGGRIAMSQYCGTYADGVRDDRVQVVTTEGEQVVTVQDNGVDAGDLVAGGDVVTMTSHDRATGGTYLYDVGDGRLLRLSDGMSSWAVGQGPTPGDQFMWTTPAGGRDATFGRKGAEVHLGEVVR